MSHQPTIATLQDERADAARAAGAARAKRWRDRRKADRVPLPRDADAAIAEALAFLIARHRKDGVNIEGRRVAAVDPADIGVLALLVLERDGFDPSKSGPLVKQRMAPREEHSWDGHMPSLSPGPVDHMRNTRAGPWTTPIEQVYAVMNGRSPS